jgi:F-type H+-transporting ATPase subunit b
VKRVRWAALAAMLFVTTWSLWAWAQHSSKPTPGETQSTGEAPADGEEPAPINWFEFGKETPPFIATIVNFGILAATYYLIGRKPIQAALQNRRDSIAKDIEEAQRMRQEAEARAKTYQARLDALESEVHTVREALVRAGEAERDRIIAEAQDKAERLKRDAEFLVLQESKQMSQDLWREALETAVSAAENLLKERVTQADQERLAEEYLAELAGSTPEAGKSGANRVGGPSTGGVS